MSNNTDNPTQEENEMVAETTEPAAATLTAAEPAPDDPAILPTSSRLRRPDPLGSPVVAVCGLSGGAGASAATMMLGFAAAAQGRGAALVADTGGTGASLAAIAKKRSEHSLTSAAHAHRLGVLEASTMFTEISPNLRLIGREPELAGDDLADLDTELADVLADAQDAHLATFVDCGRLEKEAQIEAARNATHIVWITTGNSTGARKARAAFESTNLAGSQTDLLLVKADRYGLNLEAEREMRLAAEEADALLVFCPDVGDIVEQGIETAATRMVHELRVTLGRVL